MMTPHAEMNQQQFELYQRIQAFLFDQPGTSFPFSKKLAKENQWSLDYAQRVIAEYQKFTFLAVVAGHPVAPSDAVDQVWHLHLTYSRSYWQEFCPNVLQMSFHHEPSLGGLSEHLKLQDWYSNTLISYEKFFGQAPPADIWPDPIDRFSRDLNFVRLNSQQYWMIPKLDVRSWVTFKLDRKIALLLLLISVSTLTGCGIASRIPNPLDFTGTQFLGFYLLLTPIVIFLATLLRSALRLPDGKLTEQSVELNAYETAYLVGNNSRVIETAIAHLVQQNFVIPDKARRSLSLQKPMTELSDPVERTVAKAIEIDGRIDQVRSAYIDSIQTIQNRLQQLNLLVSREQSAKAQRYPALLILCLLALGVAKIFVGISRGKPVGFLIVLCILVGIVGLCFWLIPVRRSRYGDRALKKMRGLVHSTRVTSTEPQLALAFALWGTAILPNETFAELKTVLTPVSSSGGGSGRDGSGSSGGDGGGCGGGGCGGCGGCGGA